MALFTSPCDSFGHNMFAVHNYNNEPEINTRGIKYAAYVGAQLICGIRGRGGPVTTRLGGTFGCRYDSPPPRMICENMLGLTNGGSSSNS